MREKWGVRRRIRMFALHEWRFQPVLIPAKNVHKMSRVMGSTPLGQPIGCCCYEGEPFHEGEASAGIVQRSRTAAHAKYL